MMPFRCNAVAIACVAGLLATVAPAWAQSATDKAAAEALFREGRRLFDAGQFPEACSKLAESQRLDPAPGTLLNLAGCYEKNGQTASAWVTFKGAAAASHQKGRADWEELARTRAAALEPKLSRITITVAAPATAGLVVHRDSSAVGQAEWGTPIPIDPGAHVIDAQAPHRAPFRQSVDISASGGTTTVTVPDLDVGGADSQGSAATANTGSTQRTVGLIVAGAGAVGIGLGAVFGLVAMGKENDALNNQCTADKFCTPQGLSLSQQAHDAATISTVAFGVGAAALVGGLVLYFVAPKHSETTPSVGLRATALPGGAALGMVGTW